jgi:large subunit ribosomal protein L29
VANKLAASLRDMGDPALVDELEEHKKELFRLRFQHVTGQLDNYTRLRDLRRQVARINTELRAREIFAAEELSARAARSKE